jgi:hypothetical protein
VPGAFSTQANGINGAGQIVLGSNTVHGLLYTVGNLIQIDVPGAGSTSTNGINNAGQIVGTFVASVVGDPHFTTYGGVLYDYQGIGDFLLTRSTSPGDQFDVQIRMTGFSNAGTAVITEAAATLCDHNVTFDISRASAGGSFAWIDGSPTLLNHDHPIRTLGSCRIAELSNNS